MNLEKHRARSPYRAHGGRRLRRRHRPEAEYVQFVDDEGECVPTSCSPVSWTVAPAGAVADQSQPRVRKTPWRK